MGAVQEKIKIRHGIRHDEKDADAREQEGDEKAEERAAGEPVCRLARDVGFGSHKSAVGLSGFGQRVEQIERRSGRESDRANGMATCTATIKRKHPCLTFRDELAEPPALLSSLFTGSPPGSNA